MEEGRNEKKKKNVRVESERLGERKIPAVKDLMELKNCSVIKDPLCSLKGRL